MGLYDPTPTVTIGGVDYTSETINSLQVTLGRTSIDEQPRAGYATISLVVVDGTYPPIELNAVAAIHVLDSSGADPSLFVGYVTDVTRQIIGYGSVGSTVQIDVTVAGALSRLAKLQSDDSYPKQFDGDRVAAILQSAFTSTWLEVAGSLTWSGVSASKTWDTFDPGYVGTVATPGSFELHTYSGGAVEAQSLAAVAANSALGVLYETPDGFINYDDAATRLNRVGNQGWLEIDAAYIAALGTASSSHTSDMVNTLTISYKGGSTVSGSDSTSVAEFGLFAGQRSTVLESAGDANTQLNLFLTTRALPRLSIDQIIIPLHNESLPDAVRDDLLGVFCGTPISIPNLPSAIYGGNPFFGFVEGYTWTVSDKTATLTLRVSDYALTAIAMAWQQVPAAELWSTLSPTLIWENATVVA